MASAYAAVDGGKLSAILSELPEVSATLGGEPTEWRVREVGDGNLNLVFIVEGPAGGVVVKQALPYVRLVGESWPLPLERSWFEYNALVEQGRYAPRLTPKLFHFDRDQAMIVMEYLSSHVIMRKGLIGGVEYPRGGLRVLRVWEPGAEGMDEKDVSGEGLFLGTGEPGA